MSLQALFLTALAPFSFGERTPDTVELRDGPNVVGRVVYEDDRRVIVRQGTREKEIDRARITSVRSRATDQRTMLARWKTLGAEDWDGMLALAQDCRALDLTEEAELLGFHVLSRRPGDEAAHALVGNRKSGSNWMTRDGARRVEWSKLAPLREDWGNAWELSTTHFRVRSNLPLHEVTLIAFDLENAYAACFELFARELELREILEPLNAHVHAERKTFPGLTTGRGAYFDTGSRTLLVDASTGLDRGLLVHEALHQIFYVSSLGTGRARGALPAWLDEGLAEYFATGMTHTPGRMTRRDDALDQRHFDIHANADDPYELSRVLTFDASDFLASTKTSLKYAQVYTLVHFLLHAEDGARRPATFAFLREALAGQGSPTDFKKALGGKPDALERAWTAYVGANRSR